MKKKKERNNNKDSMVLIGEGLFVGAFSGFITLAYRVALSYVGTWLDAVVVYIKSHPAAVHWMNYTIQYKVDRLGIITYAQAFFYV